MLCYFCWYFWYCCRRSYFSALSLILYKFSPVYNIHAQCSCCGKNSIRLLSLHVFFPLCVILLLIFLLRVFFWFDFFFVSLSSSLMLFIPLWICGDECSNKKESEREKKTTNRKNEMMAKRRHSRAPFLCSLLFKLCLVFFHRRLCFCYVFIFMFFLKVSVYSIQTHLLL